MILDTLWKVRQPAHTMQTATQLDWAEWEPRFAAFLDAEAGADGAHDRSHIQRVVANASHLAGLEGADTAVVIPAAWLHDCVVVPKDSPQRNQASRLAARAARDFLAAHDYPPALLPAIEHAIAAHSFSAGIEPQSLEAQVVQDADRLDAIGAIGIARCFALGGDLGTPFYDLEEPFPEQRLADDSAYVIDHFYVKLLRLAGSMRTEAGRAEAARRTAFMEGYLAQLRAEIAGLG